MEIIHGIKPTVKQTGLCLFAMPKVLTHQPHKTDSPPEQLPNIAADELHSGEELWLPMVDELGSSFSTFVGVFGSKDLKAIFSLK